MFSEENLHCFGTPLPLLELDQVPSKKPLHVQDQIVTDEQGRRRFHGAFTGGFSAGYWNTVGSKEGWTPRSFKSSRNEKTTESFNQCPEDFMDEEDRGEFGIAPKGLKISEDYTVVEQEQTRKRKFLQPNTTPIPGEPVLYHLIKPVKDKVSVRILKAWGWRPGQGVGPRQTRQAKKRDRERYKREQYLLERYGCELPGTSKASLKDLDFNASSAEEDASDEEDNNEITFAPEDYDIPPCASKQDRYGLDYVPLSRNSILGGSVGETVANKSRDQFNTSKPLQAWGKNNKKISFTGQAFGVGAFEDDDDEDVFATDDMTSYDFALEDKQQKKRILQKPQEIKNFVFGEFVLERTPEKSMVYKVEIPFGWQPRNWLQRRSRFEPLDPRKARQLDRKFEKFAATKEMTRSQRSKLLGEEIKDSERKAPSLQGNGKSLIEMQQMFKEREEKTKDLLEKISSKSSCFTAGGVMDLRSEEFVNKPTACEESTGTFKPFLNDSKKQERYEKFLDADINDEKETSQFLSNIQPVELSLWDRQMEIREFIQAKKLYRPLKGLMSDRFVSEAELGVEQKVSECAKNNSKLINVERTKITWKPHALLCKRYNIAEPFGGLMEDKKRPKKKPKLSVFDYLETSINKKEDFQTPVIVSKPIEKSIELIKPTEETDRPTEPENVIVVEKSSEPLQEKSVTKSFTPKTTLEKEVVESLHKSVTEKKELFKSIFSDSESDDEPTLEEKREEKINGDSKQLNNLSTPVIANLLRNTSPPRGIFKALFAAPEKSDNKSSNEPNEIQKDCLQIEKIQFKSKATRESNGKLEEDSNAYGPALPKQLNKSELTIEHCRHFLSESLDAKLLDIFNKQKVISNSKIEEIWIEKSKSLQSSDDETDSSNDGSSNTSNDVHNNRKESGKSNKMHFIYVIRCVIKYKFFSIMHENTPPRVPEIGDDAEEIIDMDAEILSGDEDDQEMEITFDEYVERISSASDDDDENTEEQDSPQSPVPDDSIFTFPAHTKPVFSCSLHPHNELCATGAEDDKVFIWSRNTGQILYEFTGHRDTVIDVHFNHDGTYLATADLAGDIVLHKLQKMPNEADKDGGFLTVYKVWEYSMGDMPWMRWHPATNVLIAGSEDGEIYFWRLPAGDCKILPGPGVRCDSGDISADGKKFVAAYSNGTIKLWDIRACTTVMEIDENNPMVHSTGCTTVAHDKASPFFMSGDQDGKILFSTHTGPVGAVETGDIIECMAFSPSSEIRMAASGTLSGQISIWDSSKFNLRINCDPTEGNDGITEMRWISDYTLVVATVSGNIFGYDARTGVHIFKLSGHTAAIYSFCYDRRDSIILSVSEDHSAKVFRVPCLAE
uniref:G-patch domain-containing protein n=1 Tax=Glossina brevipalpis TaxID=37001 RepID=A0A1A9WTC4_9MUSC